MNPLKKINDEQLFLQEECYIMDNTDLIKKPELFKYCDFKKKVNFIESQKLLKQDEYFVVLAFLFGLIFSWIGIVTMCRKPVRDKLRYSYNFGVILQSILLIH